MDTFGEEETDMIRTCASISVQYDNIFAPFPGADWAKGFQWAKDSGLDGVEIILSDPELLDVSAIRAKLDELELAVGTISTGQAMGMENIYMCAGSSLIRREARERLFRDIDFSVEVGKPNVTIGLNRGKGGLHPDEAVEFARQADTVVVESNYDMDMLMSGPYTYELKMRIVQGCGHLSNDECASAIKRFWHPGLRNIFLCHLSENNNTHDLAYRSAAEALREMGVEKGTISLRCLPRQYPSQMFEL